MIGLSVAVGRFIEALFWAILRVAGTITAAVVAAALVRLTGSPGGFRGQVLVHLLVGMAAPLLLALAAPVTLALRVLAPRPRQMLLAAVHSRAARLLTAPRWCWCSTSSPGPT